MVENTEEETIKNPFYCLLPLKGEGKKEWKDGGKEEGRREGRRKRKAKERKERQKTDDKLFFFQKGLDVFLKKD